MVSWTNTHYCHRTLHRFFWNACEAVRWAQEFLLLPYLEAAKTFSGPARQMSRLKIGPKTFSLLNGIISSLPHPGCARLS